MCGRYALIPNPAAWAQAAEDLGADMQAVLAVLRELGAQYNVAPTSQMPIVVQDRDTQAPAIYTARWGLIPRWWKQPEAPASTHNARLEGIQDRPMWRGAWRYKRCLIPASLWYEWQQVDKQKLPYALRPADDHDMMFAGLWDAWLDRQTGEEIISYAIITQDAVSEISQIHNRMPLILAPQVWQAWINPGLTDLRAIDAELARNQLTPLRSYRVTRYVSNSRNQGPGCIEAAAE